MKNFEEMTFKEKVEWATGTLIIAIGNGNFKSEVYSICQCFQIDAFRRGKEATLEELRKNNE